MMRRSIRRGDGVRDQRLEFNQERGLRQARGVAQPEPDGEHLHELVAPERRIVQVHRVHAIRLTFEGGPDDRRLARAGLADEQCDPAAAGYPIFKVASASR
jgi:hypothetical protein